MHLLPWDENKFIAKTYSEKRPAWVVPIAVIGLALVGLTWYMHFTAEVPYSLILTILFSLTALKAITLIFDYRSFHKWVAKMLAKDSGRDIVIVDIFAGLFGLAFVMLTIFLY